GQGEQSPSSGCTSEVGSVSHGQRAPSSLAAGLDLRVSRAAGWLRRQSGRLAGHPEMRHSANDSMLGVVAGSRVARRDHFTRVFLVVTVHASVLRHVADDFVRVFACLELADGVIPILLGLAVAVTLGYIPWRGA